MLNEVGFEQQTKVKLWHNLAVSQQPCSRPPCKPVWRSFHASTCPKQVSVGDTQQAGHLTARCPIVHHPSASTQHNGCSVVSSMSAQQQPLTRLHSQASHGLAFSGSASWARSWCAAILLASAYAELDGCEVRAGTTQQYHHHRAGWQLGQGRIRGGCVEPFTTALRGAAGAGCSGRRVTKASGCVVRCGLWHVGRPQRRPRGGNWATGTFMSGMLFFGCCVLWLSLLIVCLAAVATQNHWCATL